MMLESTVANGTSGPKPATTRPSPRSSRVHENHAMVTQVVEGVASWRCPLGEGEAIPIGAAAL